MIYVDHDTELKVRIRRLQDLLAKLQRAGCGSVDDALQATRSDLQCCERWLELLGGGTRSRRHRTPPDRRMPTPTSGKPATLASGGAKPTFRSNRALPAACG